MARSSPSFNSQRKGICRRRQSQFRCPYYKQSLDYFAQRFAEVYNNLNSAGGVDKPLFVGTARALLRQKYLNFARLAVHAKYITSTTATPPVEGANDNIVRMIQAFEDDYVFSPAFEGSFLEYVSSRIGNIAMDVEYYRDMAETSDYVLDSAAEQRESVSGVNIDEEAINMIKFEKSYSAAARIMTVLDEMLDIIINKMGIIGR